MAEQFYLNRWYKSSSECRIVRVFKVISGSPNGKSATVWEVYHKFSGRIQSTPFKSYVRYPHIYEEITEEEAMLYILGGG